jgi:hypothetical protein
MDKTKIKKLLEIKTTAIGRRHQNIKMEYLSNYCSEISQILNFMGSKPKFSMEDDLET